MRASHAVTAGWLAWLLAAGATAGPVDAFPVEPAAVARAGGPDAALTDAALTDAALTDAASTDAASTGVTSPTTASTGITSIDAGPAGERAAAREPVRAAPAAQAAVADPCADLSGPALGVAEDTLDYADRLSACGHAELAEGLYDELLAHDLAPEPRLRALAGRAASLARQQRTAEAERAYAAVVAYASSVPAARRAAAGEAARRPARRTPAGHPSPEPAPRRADMRAVQQVDGTGMRTITVGEDALVSAGGSTLSARLEELRYATQDAGARVTRPGLRLHQRLGEAVELHGNVAADHMDAGGRVDAPTRLFYDTGLGLRRDDLVRVRVGSSRTSMDNLMTMHRGGVTLMSTASVDVTPDATSRYALRYERGAQSDGVLRLNTRLETEHRVGWLPNAWLGGRVAQHDFEHSSATGGPVATSWGSRMLTLRLDDRAPGFDGRLGYGLTLGVGDGLIVQQPNRPLYDVSLRSTWRLAPGATLEARLQSMGAHAPTAGPAHRTAAGVSVNLAW